MLDVTSFACPEAHIASVEPDEAVMYFATDVLAAQARRFVDGFAGEVSYAVKANPAREVLEGVLGAGIRAFDVASPDEMHRVRRVSREAALHYNNPVRSVREIAVGKEMGVGSWSVDALSELAKLGPAVRDAEEVSVRFKLPVKGAHYDFGAKFGATPQAAVALLQAVQAAGYRPALTFHPGTQCHAPEAWESYIAAAADIARVAGVCVERLNVGGGFAAQRSAQAPDLEEVFDRIFRCTQAVFANPPKLVCEPGRALVAESYTLATRVKALRAEGEVFLNDGLYGGLAEWRDMSASTRVRVLGHKGAPRGAPSKAFKVFGPTCDSLDCLPDPVCLPADLKEGDYVLFAGMGAYSMAIATGFNGYGIGSVVRVQRV